jgi:hypothetical protein
MDSAVDLGGVEERGSVDVEAESEVVMQDVLVMMR